MGGLAVHLLDYIAQEEIDLACEKIMNTLGLRGLFLCVLIADVIPQPFTYVPLIFIAIRAAIPGRVVFAMCSGASYVAALLGYIIGWQLRGRFGLRICWQLCEDHPFVPELMRQKGPVGFA